MNDLAAGHVPARPARPRGAQAEIRLLEIEEVSLIQQADFFEDLAPDHHAGAADPIDLHRLLGWRGRHDVPAEHFAHHAQAQRAFQLAEHGVEAKGAVAHGPVGVDGASAGDADSGVGVQETHQLAQRIGQDDRVRVEQIDVLWRMLGLEGRGDGGVVAVREPAVLRQRRQRHPGPFVPIDGRLDLLGRAVARRVVGDDHADSAGDGLDLVVQRLEAVDDQIGSLVVDDDDEQLHGSSINGVERTTGGPILCRRCDTGGKSHGDYRRTDYKTVLSRFRRCDGAPGGRKQKPGREFGALAVRGVEGFGLSER